MRHFAVIGSGPAGFYTAEALAKAYGDAARIDIIDKLPVPYGLIRFGVAPDHQSIKAVSRRYDKVAEGGTVRFVGNVAVGEAVSIDELKRCYDAVILATGAPNDRKLGIPGEDLPGVVGSAAFVGWYNGHPDFADLDPPLDGDAAAVIGNGNVALDVARILAKTRAEFAGSDIVGHALDALDGVGDPHDHHRRAARPAPDRDDRPRNWASLAISTARCRTSSRATCRRPRPTARSTPARASRSPTCATSPQPHDDKPKHIEFDFFARPVAIEGRWPRRAADRRTHRARRRRAKRRHGRDLCHPGEPDRQLHRLSDPAHRRRAL